MISAKIAQLSGQDLYNALMHIIYSTPQDMKDMGAEVCIRCYAAFSAVQAVATASAQAVLQQVVTGKTAAQLKLDKPAKFEDESKELANWLFNLEQYCMICDVTDIKEQVKVAVTFLSGRALTWWRAVACKSWATRQYASGWTSHHRSPPSSKTCTTNSATKQSYLIYNNEELW